MDGVGLDVTATTQKLNINNNEVMDVVEVLSNAVYGVLGIASSNNHIAGSAESNLPSNVSSEVEVSLTPSEENLHNC